MMRSRKIACAICTALVATVIMCFAPQSLRLTATTDTDHVHIGEKISIALSLVNPSGREVDVFSDGDLPEFNYNITFARADGLIPERTPYYQAVRDVVTEGKEKPTPGVKLEPFISESGEFGIHAHDKKIDTLDLSKLFMITDPGVYTFTAVRRGVLDGSGPKSNRVQIVVSQ